MPYKDPVKAKENNRIRVARFRKNNPTSYRKTQNKYWASVRKNKPCLIEGCENFCPQKNNYCDQHSLKVMTVDELLYDRTRMSLQRLGINCSVVGREFYFMMLLLMIAKDEINAVQKLR